ncbi:MAG: hypothetical protein AB7Q16_06005 [Vicinamibacterales bacterium]
MRRCGLTIAFAWLLASTLLAAGTVTQTHFRVGNIRKVVFACTADAANGSFPATAISVPIEGRLIQLITDPGATAPTDNYDITLVDGNGLDVLQGVGANRDTAVTEAAAIVFSGTSVHPVVDESDTLTLTIANNIVNSATLTVTLVYALGS